MFKITYIVAQSKLIVPRSGFSRELHQFLEFLITKQFDCIFKGKPCRFVMVFNPLLVHSPEYLPCIPVVFLGTFILKLEYPTQILYWTPYI